MYLFYDRNWLWTQTQPKTLVIPIKAMKNTLILYKPFLNGSLCNIEDLIALVLALALNDYYDIFREVITPLQIAGEGILFPFIKCFWEIFILGFVNRDYIVFIIVSLKTYASFPTNLCSGKIFMSSKWYLREVFVDIKLFGTTKESGMRNIINSSLYCLPKCFLNE